MSDAPFTFDIDPARGDPVVDDGHLAAAPSAAVGLVVWTLRTPLGQCPAEPDLGVDWSVAKTDREGATVSLQKELTRALQWIVEAGFMSALEVTVTRPAPGRIQYVIAFTAEGEPYRLRGSL